MPEWTRFPDFSHLLTQVLAVLRELARVRDEVTTALAQPLTFLHQPIEHARIAKVLRWDGVGGCLVVPLLCLIHRQVPHGRLPAPTGSRLPGAVP